MNDTEREQFAEALERKALALNYTNPNGFPATISLLRRAASRIRMDGLRLKAQSKIAITLNKELEATIARGLEKST